MLDKLHVCHFGLTELMQKVKLSLYWPGMLEGVRTIEERCNVCNEYGKLKRDHCQLFPRVYDRQTVSCLTEREQNMEALRDRGLTEHRELRDGEKVRVWLNGQWKHGTVSGKSREPRSYVVRTRNGGEYRRNRRDIRPSGEPDHMFEQVQTETNFGGTQNDQAIVQADSGGQGSGRMGQEHPYISRFGRVSKPPQRLSY